MGYDKRREYSRRYNFTWKMEVRVLSTINEIYWQQRRPSDRIGIRWITIQEQPFNVLQLKVLDRYLKWASGSPTLWVIFCVGDFRYIVKHCHGLPIGLSAHIKYIVKFSTVIMCKFASKIFACSVKINGNEPNMGIFYKLKYMSSLLPWYFLLWIATHFLSSLLPVLLILAMVLSHSIIRFLCGSHYLVTCLHLIASKNFSLTCIWFSFWRLSVFWILKDGIRLL